MARTHPATRSTKSPNRTRAAAAASKSHSRKRTTKKASPKAAKKKAATTATNKKRKPREETPKQKAAKEAAAVRGAAAADAVDLANSVGAFLTGRLTAPGTKDDDAVSEDSVPDKDPPLPHSTMPDPNDSVVVPKFSTLPSAQIGEVAPGVRGAMGQKPQVIPGDWEQLYALYKCFADIWNRPKAKLDDDRRAPYKARPDELKFFAGMIGYYGVTGATKTGMSGPLSASPSVMNPYNSLLVVFFLVRCHRYRNFFTGFDSPNQSEEALKEKAHQMLNHYQCGRAYRHFIAKAKNGFWSDEDPAPHNGVFRAYKQYLNLLLFEWPVLSQQGSPATEASSSVTDGSPQTGTI